MSSAQVHIPEPDAYAPPRLLLQWHVTSRCNLHCAHCYDEADRAANLPLDTLLSILAQLEALLGRWRSKCPSGWVGGHITIAGGEPLLRQDIWLLLEQLAARRRSFSFAVLTNGSLIDRATARRLHQLGPAFVQVSLDGGRATHDRLRCAGDYDRVVAAIRQLVAAGVRTLVSFTASRANYREFPAVAHLGRALGAVRIWADRLIPVGRGAALQELVLTPAETREFFEIMHAASAPDVRHPPALTEVSMHRALQFLCGGAAPYHCTAGDTLLALQPNGDLLPCRRLPIPVGNVLTTPLAELYHGSAVLRELRAAAAAPHGCARCAYVKLCRGGLRCLAWTVHGRTDIADPGCWRAEHPPPPGSRAVRLHCGGGSVRPGRNQHVPRCGQSDPVFEGCRAAARPAFRHARHQDGA